MFVFLFLMCLTSASLHPLDSPSDSFKQHALNDDSLSYSMHEARGLHLAAPLHCGQDGSFAPKTFPANALNSVNPG